MNGTRGRGQGRAGGRGVPALLASALLCTALSAAAGSDDAGKARYQFILNCAGCHQADGSGARSGGVPTLRGQMGHFLKTPEGRAFLVQVPGTSNSALSNADIARMLNWMAAAFSAATLPPDFQPYTEAEVSALRANKLTDVSGARRAIVARLVAEGIRIE
ncbi:cytochrome c4 [Azoarcus olearius]|uniref:Conserved hypothetical cytochrome c-552 n=1 Tax=Azoarcus sp. (strain BH72) TaxID=418699 RepID=A1K7R8_AZOSB|nr:c-type cytochrome [Azoarcus olearius]CAL94873.1 conserved hypothetical cytochrome c-552 [Azoarcus olearius]